MTVKSLNNPLNSHKILEYQFDRFLGLRGIALNGYYGGPLLGLAFFISLALPLQIWAQAPENFFDL
jgi:hypothetical protein